METPPALGACKLLRRAGRPINLGAALKLQEVAGLEIDEQQRGARFSDQIAERVEIAVAAKIGNRQYVAVDADETRPAAAMRDVGAISRTPAGARAARVEETTVPGAGGCGRRSQRLDVIHR